MGGAAIKSEATEEEGDGKAEGAGKVGGARQVLAGLQQGFRNGETVVVALEGRVIKKVNVSWFYRQQLNLILHRKLSRRRTSAAPTSL